MATRVPRGQHPWPVRPEEGSMATSDAWQRFLASMEIDHEKWHDGLG